MRAAAGLLFSVGLAVTAWPETIDRIAVTVDTQVITESQIEEELAIVALLNHQTIVTDVVRRREAADRLVEQALLAREVTLSRFEAPSDEDVEKYVRGVEEDISSKEPLRAVLTRYDLDEAVLRRHLALQLTTLRFVEFRFRTEAAVTDADLRAYLERQNARLPVKDLTRSEIESTRERIIAERTDAALAAWLEEARKRFNITYLDRGLQ